MPSITEPYEFLVRWKEGAVSGAQIQFLETITDDTGKLLAQKVTDAQPVGAKGFPIEDVLSKVQADALAALALKDAEITEVAKQRDECKARADELYAFVLKAEDALNNGASLDEVEGILRPLIQIEKTPEDEKRIAELQAQIAELNAKEAELQAEIDKLNGSK